MKAVRAAQLGEWAGLASRESQLKRGGHSQQGKGEGSSEQGVVTGAEAGRTWGDAGSAEEGTGLVS